MIRTITRFQIEDLIAQAKQSPRKRQIYRLHEHHEPVQRMVNALIPGTYVTPHKHENPDKVELFNILAGRLAVLAFDEWGDVTTVIELNATGTTRMVDIAPRIYHAIIPLETCAALEIIEGPYDPATHKTFAPWAPLEDNPKASDYLMYLTSIVDNWRG